jgi:hypothetical protein
MALIEYKITANASGNATVTVAVVSIEKGDTIRFTSTNPSTAIRFTNDSPFAYPPVGQELLIGLGQGPFPVVKPNTGGAFHFECGEHAIPPRVASKRAAAPYAPEFHRWGGAGGDIPTS